MQSPKPSGPNLHCPSFASYQEGSAQDTSAQDQPRTHLGPKCSAAARASLPTCRGPVHRQFRAAYHLPCLFPGPFSSAGALRTPLSHVIPRGHPDPWKPPASAPPGARDASDCLTSSSDSPSLLSSSGTQPRLGPQPRPRPRPLPR